MSDSTHEPGLYRKGDVTRQARSRSEAVALVFDGFRRVEDEAPAETPSPTVSDTAPVKDSTTPSPSLFARGNQSQEDE